MCAFSSPLHAAHQFVLDVEGQAGGDAVGIELVGGQAFGLQEDLVAFLVGKAVDLVLDAGAVARAHALDLARELSITTKSLTTASHLATQWSTRSVEWVDSIH